MKKLNLLLVLTFLCLWANAQYQILVKRGSETLVYDKIETVFAELQKNDNAKYLPAKDSIYWLSDKNHYRADFAAGKDVAVNSIIQ